MPRTDVTQMAFAKLYPLLVNKAEKKGRSRAEVDQVRHHLWSLLSKGPGHEP